ncbi:MAG: SulP family inorganic anion transporter, partial [Thermoguttaceae bacterium]
EPVPIQMGFPSFSVPSCLGVDFENLFRAAIAIAMLGAIESLLSAVVADGMTGTKHRSNTELIAQGIANVIVPFFGGIPATGAIARTATNIKNGGRTPFAGIIHAMTLLLIVICLGNYAAKIPLCVLAGILMVVALNMSEYRHFLRMLHAPKSDISVMILTFALTIFLDLTIAIPVGLVLASFHFMRHMEHQFRAATVDDKLHSLAADDPNEDPQTMRLFEVPDGVHVFEVNGPFFFGAVSKFQAAIEENMPHVLILRMRNVPIMDATGLHAIDEILKWADSFGASVLFSGIQPQPHHVLTEYGLWNRIGEENCHLCISQALLHAAEIIENENQSRKEREMQQLSEITPMKHIV